MNIEDKNANSTIEFCNVPSGEIFLYEDSYYLAIDPLEDGYGNEVNAINLSDGDGGGTYFDEDTEVLWVKATLTIENR